MKKINPSQKVLFLSLVLSTAAMAEEYIVEVSPMAKAKLKLEEKTYKHFNVKKTFRAFDRDLAVIDVADESAFKQNFMPNYFSYMEKNLRYEMTKAPARPTDLSAWNPKPVMTNDPSYTELWAILNFGQKLQQTGVKKMDSSIGQAWNYTANIKKVYVGVMDTGVDYKHKDLAANIWTTKNPAGKIFHGYNALAEKYDVEDDSFFYHGTHVAGTIAAIPNNKIGIAGIAWNAIIVPVKIFSGDSSTDSAAVLKGLNWFYQHPEVKVINHSWVGAGESKLVKEAFKKLDDAGVINVFGAGNSSTNIDQVPVYPGAFNLKHGIIVAAHDSRGKKPEFSNYGKNNVDIAAPGVDILSLSGGSKYRSLFGTSMAAPHVTGSVAVLLGLFPDLTPEQIKNKIIEGGALTPGLEETSRNAKRLNLLGAINQ
jgi:subtilisin family serine protease